MSRYAKAIIAAVTAGYGTYVAVGGSQTHAIVAAAVTAVVTGLLTWGVPNDISADLRAVQRAVTGSRVVGANIPSTRRTSTPATGLDTIPGPPPTPVPADHVSADFDD